MITWAFVRIAPCGETTKPEPWAVGAAEVREDGDDARASGGRRSTPARSPARRPGAIVRTAAGVFAAGAGSRTTTVLVVSAADEPRRPAEAERCGGAEGGADERENGDAH